MGSSRRCATGSSKPARMGFFAKMMEGLATKGTEQKTNMIDATYLKAHRTASSLRAKKGA
jgi:hypothetical protein